MNLPLDDTQVLLVDNGSLRPDATIRLREVAAQLSARIGIRVWPVSLLHSNKVDPRELCGEKAFILEEWIRLSGSRGASRICIVPYFLGPSRALTHFVPQLLTSLRLEIPELQVTMTPPLYEEGDTRLATILADGVKMVVTREQWEEPKVFLVDHGTPARAVNRVRNEVARQLQELLSWPVTATSMERREGASYDFNEPLLESALNELGDRDAKVVVAMFFLGPGKHAGNNGDVATICDRARERNPRLSLAYTPLLGEHPLLLDILADRLLKSEHWSL